MGPGLFQALTQTYAGVLHDITRKNAGGRILATGMDRARSLLFLGFGSRAFRSANGFELVCPCLGRQHWGLG